jgi:hypothetical protein
MATEHYDHRYIRLDGTVLEQRQPPEGWVVVVYSSEYDGWGFRAPDPTYTVIEVNKRDFEGAKHVLEISRKHALRAGSRSFSLDERTEQLLERMITMRCEREKFEQEK